MKRRKGQNQKAYAYELQHEAHISCIKVHEEILRRHHISPNDYLNAVIEGIFLLFPELDETKSVRGYKDRMRKAEEDIGDVFPNLKKKEEKKQGEEKEGKDK